MAHSVAPMIEPTKSHSNDVFLSGIPAPSFRSGKALFLPVERCYTNPLCHFKPMPKIEECLISVELALAPKAWWKPLMSVFVLLRDG